MDRRDTAHRFRERLREAMEKGQVNRSNLAAQIGIDRSTLSQLLSAEADRLPRADTAAAIASVLQVSSTGCSVSVSRRSSAPISWRNRSK